MAQGDWDIDTTWLDRIEEEFDSGIQKMCEDAAEETLSRARALIPQPGTSRWATGALKESGYIKTPTSSGYEEAVSRAKSAPATRIEERGLIEDEYSEPLPDGDGLYIAVLHFPLHYADLIRFGFYHVRGGYDIPGNDFLLAAMQPIEKTFEARANRLVKSIMKKYSL